MKESFKLRLKNFILSHALLRKLRLFYGNSVKPLLIKLFLVFIFLTFTAFFLLKTYNPNFFASLFFEGSRRLSYSLGIRKSGFKTINIHGNLRIKRDEIVKIVNDFYATTDEKIRNDLLFDHPKLQEQLQNSFSNTQGLDYQHSIQNLIDEIRHKLPFVSKITINRTIPDILNISIVEFEPFAIWYEDDNKFIIDKEGNSVAYRDEYESFADFDAMVILSGKNANLHAKSLFNLISVNPEIGGEIYSANWVGGRRWDLRFNNGLIVKMPELEISEAWKAMVKMLEDGSIKDFKTIDFRVKNKVYIETINAPKIKNEST